MAQFDMKALARLGAEARIQQLNDEITAIQAAFPDLRKRGQRKAASEASTPSPRRRRKAMSAAQRKAVGLRMKKYWAERRKATK